MIFRSHIFTDKIPITRNIQNGGGDGGGLAGQGGRPCIGICFLRLVVVVVVMLIVIEMVMLVIEMAETVGFVLIFFCWVMAPVVVEMLVVDNVELDLVMVNVEGI